MGCAAIHFSCGVGAGDGIGTAQEAGGVEICPYSIYGSEYRADGGNGGYVYAVVKSIFRCCKAFFGGNWDRGKSGSEPVRKFPICILDGDGYMDFLFRF